MSKKIILTQVTLKQLVAKIEEVIDFKIAKHFGTESIKPPVSDLVSETELCAYLNITRQTLSRWRRENKIPFARVGRSIRYNLREIETKFKLAP